jgi:hypothetical protein
MVTGGFIPGLPSPPAPEIVDFFLTGKIKDSIQQNITG